MSNVAPNDSEMDAVDEEKLKACEASPAGVEHKSCDALEKEVQEGRQELPAEKNSDRFRVEDEKLHRSPKKSHGQKVQEDKMDAGYSVDQLCDSLNSLASLQAELVSQVNSIRTVIYDRENQRTRNGKDQRQRLQLQIDEVQAICTQKMNNISKALEQLSDVKVPQDLMEGILEQRKVFDEAMQLKDKVGQAIDAQIKVMDEEYQQIFLQQSKDVDILIAAMGKQVVTLQEAYRKELEVIENEFLEQRRDLLMSNKAEMDGFMKKVKAAEIATKNKALACISEHSKALQKIQDQDAEDYNLLKVKLETDIQTLEQHLESMQGAYQLNAEKLDYNHRVLLEREHDNYITAGQQKRRLTKQRDTLCHLKVRHKEYERKFSMQNGKLAVEFEKIVKSLEDLQNKENKFKLSHEKKHLEFFRMHQHLLAVLVSKLLQADKYIHEQQLGWKWHPPSDEMFQFLATCIQSKDEQESGTECSRNLSSVLTSSTPVAENCETTHQNQTTPCDTIFAYSNDIAGEHQLLEMGFNRLSLQDTATSQQSDCDGSGLPSSLSIPESKVGSLPSNTTNSDQTVKNLPLQKPSKFISQLEIQWRSFARIIDSKILHVWAAFEVILLNYNQLLKKRMNLANEVKVTSQLNFELRKAVAECMDYRGEC